MSEPTTTAAPAAEAKYFDDCTIKDAYLSEPLFPVEEDPLAYDVVCEVLIHQSGQPDTKVDVSNECSSRYGIGNNASKTRLQLTVETMERLGVKYHDEEKDYNAKWKELSTLVGTKCRVTAKPTRNGGTAYYFNTARQRQRIGNLAERMARLMGQQVAPAAAPAPEANPFS